ncbi:MAG TPA: hypothetical protein VKT75_00770 [Acidobacteriaceae bacterium]|nr:hypothetical protein [Acidobacteriaceae bacterium]
MAATPGIFFVCRLCTALQWICSEQEHCGGDQVSVKNRHACDVTGQRADRRKVLYRLSLARRERALNITVSLNDATHAKIPPVGAPSK